MTKDEAIKVLNDYDINFERNTPEEISEAHEMAIEALGQKSCEDCCNGNQEEKAKLCQKSYIAGMEHNCENEQIIRIKKGTLKARTGKYVVYDAEWLKEHFNTTEAKIYGQSKPSERTEERTEMHACDCVSRQAVLELLHKRFTDGFDSDKWWNSTAVLYVINEAPLVTPQPKEEQQPKTGHWVLSGGYWRCSECKEKALLKLDKATGGYREYEPVRSKYCPKCGAKMQEAKE